MIISEFQHSKIRIFKKPITFRMIALSFHLKRKPSIILE